MPKIAVIGAGASGIIAALKLSLKNEVLLLEKNDKIGKKILVTGNGKCNLWNTNLFNDVDVNKYYYSNNLEFINDYINKYKDETYSYLTKELGIKIKEKNEYIYPYSQTATSIRELLNKLVDKNPNINLITNFNAVKFERVNNSYNIYNDNNEYYTCDYIVISCGTSASNLGTNSINNLLLEHDIKINDYMPGLVPVKLDESFLKELSGTRVDAKLSLYNNGSFIKEEIGELQFADYGISGIVSLNLSTLINKLNGNKKIVIDFMPDISYEKINEMINTSKNITVEDLFETVFNYKLLFLLLKKANIKRNEIVSNMTNEEIKNLINTIKNYEVNVSGTLGFDRSQIACGGIDFNEVDENLQLKKLPNVFVTGEVLDVAGICGGFNLAFAFMSGYQVGKCVNDEII